MLLERTILIYGSKCFLLTFHTDFMNEGKELSHLSCTTSSHHFRPYSGIDMLTFRAWRQSMKLYERGIEIDSEHNLFLSYISKFLSSFPLKSKLQAHFSMKSAWNLYEINDIYTYIILLSLKLLLVWFCSAIRSTALLFSLLSWFILLFQS